MFVKYEEKNVARGFEDQFDKESQQSNDNYGITYDYGLVSFVAICIRLNIFIRSVMHYSEGRQALFV